MNIILLSGHKRLCFFRDGHFVSGIDVPEWLR